MGKLKEKLYDFFVRKNGRVWYEYERYVREHMEEHHLHRFRHLKLLLKLNWFYRVKKGNTPYLYWDVPLNPDKRIEGSTNSKNREIISKCNNVEKKTEIKKVTSKIKMPYRGVESSIRNIREPQHIVKKIVNYDIISFDVFDTLIFRPIAPKDLFKILEHENNIQHFALLREQTERELRELAFRDFNTREITLEDIYEEIERKTGLDKMLGMQKEVEGELNLCFANPYMKRVFDLLIANKKRIIIVTDMYLPCSAIESILDKAGYKGYEQIFVSGDLKKSKAVGDMYKYIKHIYNGCNIFHIGDNKHSDINMAKANGIESYYYKNITEIGETYRAEGMSSLFSSAYAGIVNSKIHNGLEKFSAAYEMGYIYGGFYVLGYVNWIHKFAEEHSLEKVVFLARDGEIYKRVYDELYDDIPSEYMLCSRSMMIRCSVKVNRYDFLRRYLLYRVLNGQKYTVLNLCEDLGLLGEIKEIKKYYNLSENNVITKENYQMLMNFVISNIDQVEKSLSIEEKALKMYITYILGSAKKVAFIDVGWAGSGPNNLKILIENVWKMECKVYGLIAAESSLIQKEDIYSYIFSIRKNRIHYDAHLKNQKAVINNDLFEMFTQSCDPSIKRITMDTNEKIKFEFASPIVEGYEQIKQIHNGIIDFVKDYSLRFEKYRFLREISGYDAYCPFRVLKRDVDYFKTIMGEFPIETDTGGSVLEPILLNKYLEKKGF